MAGLPGGGDGQHLRILGSATGEAGIGTLGDLGAKLPGARRVRRSADSRIEHHGQVTHRVDVALPNGAFEPFAGLGETGFSELALRGRNVIIYAWVDPL